MNTFFYLIFLETLIKFYRSCENEFSKTIDGYNLSYNNTNKDENVIYVIGETNNVEKALKKIDHRNLFREGKFTRGDNLYYYF